MTVTIMQFKSNLPIFLHFLKVGFYHKVWDFYIFLLMELLAANNRILISLRSAIRTIFFVYLLAIVADHRNHTQKLVKERVNA